MAIIRNNHILAVIQFQAFYVGLLTIRNQANKVQNSIFYAGMLGLMHIDLIRPAVSEIIVLM